MRPYSEDLRRKIVEALQRGMSKARAAHLFGVSLSSVKRYARMARQERSLAPKKIPGRPPKTGVAAERLLKEDIKKRPAATIADRRRFLEHIVGTRLSDSTVRRLLKRLGFSRKKVHRRGGKRRVAKGVLASASS
jgi:transposase